MTTGCWSRCKPRTGPATGRTAAPRSRSRSGGGRGQQPDAEIAAAIRRTDLLADAARLLLENASVSESVILQRCARLLATGLHAWVIVDVRRRGPLQRHFVAGPDDPAADRLAQVVTAVGPEPGTAPHQVFESGTSLLITHAEDEELLGRDLQGNPLLPQLGPSLLAVPVADGDRVLGALTLVRPAQAGYFGLPDVGLAEQVGRPRRRGHVGPADAHPADGGGRGAALQPAPAGAEGGAGRGHRRRAPGPDARS